MVGNANLENEQRDFEHNIVQGTGPRSSFQLYQRESQRFAVWCQRLVRCLKFETSGADNGIAYTGIGFGTSTCYMVSVSD